MSINERAGMPATGTKRQHVPVKLQRDSMRQDMSVSPPQTCT